MAVETSSAGAFDPGAAGWEAHRDTGFIGLVGPLWTRSEGEATLFGFLADPKHANMIDVVQGGMLMTFADRALGVVAWNAVRKQPCVTIQLNVQFVSSARMGEFVEVRPEVVRRTNSLVFMQGTLTVGARAVAVANGIWKVLARAAPDEGAARPR